MRARQAGPAERMLCGRCKARMHAKGARTERRALAQVGIVGGRSGWEREVGGGRGRRRFGLGGARMKRVRVNVPRRVKARR